MSKQLRNSILAALAVVGIGTGLVFVSDEGPMKDHQGTANLLPDGGLEVSFGADAGLMPCPGQPGTLAPSLSLCP